MAKLVDARDLKSLDFGHVGSIPTAPTTFRPRLHLVYAPAHAPLSNLYGDLSDSRMRPAPALQAPVRRCSIDTGRQNAESILNLRKNCSERPFV